MTARLTPEAQEIARRAEAATTGPWSYRVRAVGHCCYVIDPERPCSGGHPIYNTFVEPLGLQVHGPETPFCERSRTEAPTSNGVFIAHARTDIPALLAEVKVLREALQGEPCAWGRDLAELLEWVAQRREWEAAQEDAEECVAPILRKAAGKIRAALDKGKGRRPQEGDIVTCRANGALHPMLPGMCDKPRFRFSPEAAKPPAGKVGAGEDAHPHTALDCARCDRDTPRVRPAPAPTVELSRALVEKVEEALKEAPSLRNASFNEALAPRRGKDSTGVTAAQYARECDRIEAALRSALEEVRRARG